MQNSNAVSITGLYIVTIAFGLILWAAVNRVTALEGAPEPRTTEEVRAPEAPSLQHTLVMCELNTRRLLSEVESLQIPRWER